jgi:hypothetical protein
MIRASGLLECAARASVLLARLSWTAPCRAGQDSVSYTRKEKAPVVRLDGSRVVGTMANAPPSPIEGMVRKLLPSHDVSRSSDRGNRVTRHGHATPEERTHVYYFSLQPAGFSDGSWACSSRRHTSERDCSTSTLNIRRTNCRITHCERDSLKPRWR